MGAVKHAIEHGAVFELGNGPAIGEGDGSLKPGAMVRVLDVVERGTPGVGRSEDPQVIVAHRYYGLPTRAADGQYAYLEHVRVLAIPIPSFARRFTPSVQDTTPEKPVT